MQDVTILITRDNEKLIASDYNGRSMKNPVYIKEGQKEGSITFQPLSIFSDPGETYTILDSSWFICSTPANSVIAEGYKQYIQKIDQIFKEATAH